jgi:hypothetical protein
MIVFKELFMADVEDPELYAAMPILEWQESEQGKWVMENALEQPYFRIVPSMETMGYRIQIYGKLSERDEVYYRLKYDIPSTHC